MTAPQILAFGAGVAILVFTAYWVTGARCLWFGHDWYRTTAWARRYRCRQCGTERINR